MAQPVRHVSRHGLRRTPRACGGGACRRPRRWRLRPEGIAVPMPMTDAQTTRAKKINIGGAKGQGFFDLMFNLPPLVATDNDLEALPRRCSDSNPDSPALDNHTIPAGFTYLGQFIDHDISLDLTLSARSSEIRP